MGLVGPTVSTRAFPMPLEGVMYATGMLANLFEEDDWVGRLSRIGDWNDPLSVIKDLLELMIVSCELSNFLVFAFREAELNTL